MSKGNKCNKCLELLEATRASLASRKDWEVKAKEADREAIKYWEEKYNNPKTDEELRQNPYCYCYHGGTGGGGSLGLEERSCDKCKQSWYVNFNEHGDAPPNDHTCEGKQCSTCGNTFIGYKCQKCEDNQNNREKEQEKQQLESSINLIQIGLKQMKLAKGQPGYSEHTVQQLERQLAELKQKYQTKFGELPSSLRDDNERERAKMETMLVCE